MSAQTPSCQLLDRPAFAEDPDFAGFYAVAPPDDPWVWHAAGGVISADERLLSRSRAAGRPYRRWVCKKRQCRRRYCSGPRR